MLNQGSKLVARFSEANNLSGRSMITLHTRILCFTPLISQWIPQIHTSNRIEQESGFNTPSKSCLKESSSEPLVSEFPLQSAKKILESPKPTVDPSEPS